VPFEANSILLFGAALLGGFFSGEASRRLLDLPRTTGYVVFGLAVGKSGFGWIDPYVVESARFFVDLALGLILFELGHRIPRDLLSVRHRVVAVGLAESLVSFSLMTAALVAVGFPATSAMFAAAIGMSTSPAITIATSSDVGARGPRTDVLYALVALNGAVAFCAAALIQPHLDGTVQAEAWAASSTVVISLALGTGLAAFALLVAKWLGPHAEHQHLLILGLIITGVGFATSLDMSALLTLLSFGVIARLLDRRDRIVAIRIASDARIFLVVTFVLAGAVLDASLLREAWMPATAFVLARLIGKALPVFLLRARLDMSAAQALHAGIGLMPMSSVALVLLADAHALHGSLDPTLSATLLSAIFMMQLVGPIATQSAIRGFGEASRLNRSRAEHAAGAARC
jgi:Kef-type K+ transport system membrane component KefB